MANAIEAVIHRVALAIKAGTLAVTDGINEAKRDIDDLFAGKPHGYDRQRVSDLVVARVNELKDAQRG